MSDFALRTDDGDVYPEQTAYVDGYHFGDRLLESVRFKVEVKPNGEGLSELVCTGVHPEDASYVSQSGSKERIKRWCEQAVEHMTNDGDAVAEDGETTLHWGDA